MQNPVLRGDGENFPSAFLRLHFENAVMEILTFFKNYSPFFQLKIVTELERMPPPPQKKSAFQLI